MENSVNKVCPKCGSFNRIDAKFCSNCGTELPEENIVYNENNSGVNIQNSDDEKAKKLGIISLVLYFTSSVVTGIFTFLLPASIRDVFSSLLGLGPLAGIVVMIVGRVKYPNNKFLKIVMWLIIGSIILGLIAFMIFFIWCYFTCINMDTSGCN